MSYRRQTLFQISDVANGLIDPILAKRAGINTMLLGAWDDIAGPDFAGYTKPEKLAWQRGAGEASDGTGFVPGQLTIACDGARALFLAHAQGELIQRVNGFFGFAAIDRIRIVQKPVSANRPVRRGLPVLAANEQKKLTGLLGEIEDDRLRAALERLGRGVIGRPKKRQS